MLNALILLPAAAEFAKALGPKFPEVNFLVEPVRGFAEVADLLPQAEIIISRGHGFDTRCLSLAKRLNWFHVTMSGTDHIAPVLAGSDVTLTNGRGSHGVQITEMAILHMMAFTRQIPELVRMKQARQSDRPTIRVLDGKTICLVGVGAIAEHAARVFQALGMMVTGVSRSARTPEGFDRIFSRDRLHDAVAEADFVLLLVPYSAETAGMINADVFRAMRSSAILINLARGGVVDEAALIAALKSGEIAGAGLDVFSEFPLPPDNPLWQMENVFMTPWTGGQTDRGVQNALKIIVPNMEAFVSGRRDRMVNVVA
jgi:D-2-hydroxyacid dehydrogenase (NADP+)